MPSTKDLSERMEVSLVTTHRALQELVASGVLQRSQGKGTFVHERYFDRKRTISECRLGLVFHSESSLADFYHSQILEGVRRAAQALSVDLVLLRFGEDVRNECNGFLFVNPLPEDMDVLASHLHKKSPALIVGARSSGKLMRSIDVDNVDLARQAISHLTSLGHRSFGCVGGADYISNSHDRWTGFSAACHDAGIRCSDQQIVRALSWHLEETERIALTRMLMGANRPTAIFAAGYYFALDVYGAATTAGLRIPEQLSVIGVDDPPSAAHLSPPLTTLRQPLVQLGSAAVTSLVEQIQRNNGSGGSTTLRAELVVRRSTGAAPIT